MGYLRWLLVIEMWWFKVLYFVYILPLVRSVEFS